MKNTSWNQVFAGDVVQFMYASQDGKKGNRTVICLDPKFRYKKKSTGRIVELFVGLQIDVVGRQKTLTQMELKKLIELLGESDQDESDQQLERATLNDEARLKKIYNTLKIFLRDNDIFRTFLIRECRRRRVFLLDKFADLNKLQVKNVGKQLINERRTKGELEVSEVGI